MLHQEPRIWGNIRTESRIACIEDMKASPLHTLHAEFYNDVSGFRLLQERGGHELATFASSS